MLRLWLLTASSSPGWLLFHQLPVVASPLRLVARSSTTARMSSYLHECDTRPEDGLNARMPSPPSSNRRSRSPQRNCIFAGICTDRESTRCSAWVFPDGPAAGLMPLVPFVASRPVADAESYNEVRASEELCETSDASDIELVEGGWRPGAPAGSALTYKASVLRAVRPLLVASSERGGRIRIARQSITRTQRLSQRDPDRVDPHAQLLRATSIRQAKLAYRTIKSRQIKQRVRPLAARTQPCGLAAQPHATMCRWRIARTHRTRKRG
eukprot:scaffold178848_cov32-Tisochrysis_lutea.AAC.3